MNKHVLFLPLLLAAAPVVAQTNFRPGYVLPLAGDTLRGEVDSRGAQRNARLARFRPAPGAAVTEYSPRQLRGYGLTGDRLYQAETVVLTDSLQRQTLLNVTADTLRRPSFLEVLVQGPASLLYLRDERNNDHYYLKMQGQPVQELVQTTRQVVDAGVTYQRKSDEFRRTLAASMQQCMAVQPVITTVRYDQAGLIRVVRSYNECVGGVSALPASASRKNHVRLGVVAGGESSRMQLDYNYLGLPTTINMQGDAQLVVGLTLNIRLTGLNKNISARLEALYEKQRYESGPVIPANITQGREFRIALTSIRLPLLVRYTYPKGSIRPFAQVGYSFSHLSRADNEVREVYRNTTGGYDYAAWRPFIAPRKLEQGIIGSLGLTTAWENKRNLAVEARYERSDGFSESVGIGSRINRLYLLLSYDLTK